MRILNVVGDTQYGLLESDDLYEMTCLLGNAFSRHEPMAVAVGLPRVEVEAIVSAYGPKALSEQLTVLARHVATGRLVGAMLTDDFGTPPPSGLEAAAPTFAPIGVLLDGLDDEYRATRTIGPGTHLHLFMVAVAQDASSRGIASTLITECMNNGKERGYTTAVTEATGSASQHVFRRLGFEDLFLASYRHFVFGGQQVFSSIVNPEGTLLMVRDL